MANPPKIFVTSPCTECSKSLKINSTLLDLINDKWIFWDYHFIYIHISNEKCPKEIGGGGGTGMDPPTTQNIG